MTGSTPGPWWIGYDPDNGRPLEILAIDDDHRVAFMASNGNPADASLIAAAPDLLSALRDIMAVADPDGEATDIWAVTARAALAKATGI